MTTTILNELIHGNWEALSQMGRKGESISDDAWVTIFEKHVGMIVFKTIRKVIFCSGQYSTSHICDEYDPL